jgi:hypothetical protein
MDEDQQIGAELRQLVLDDPLDPIDSTALLNRGRKGRRRRRALSAAGVVSAVAAVGVLGATVLPNLKGSAEPAVSGSSPGVTVPGRIVRQPATGVDDPRVSDAVLLKACQTKLNNQADLSSWRITTRTTLPTIGTMLVAVEPNSTRVVTCDLYGKQVPATEGPSSTTHLWPRYHQETKLSPNLLSAGTNCASSPKLPPACQGFLIVEADRLPLRVVKLHVDFKNGRTVDVPVKDGWYSVMTASGHNGLVAPVYQAYDAVGRLVPFDGEQALESVRYP